MKKKLLKKWDAISIAFISILYGIELIVHPDVLESYKVFEVVGDLFDSYTYGIIFIVVGSLKLASIVLKNFILKLTSIFFLVFLWMFFTVGFFLSSSETFTWILTFGISLTAFGVGIKEWLD